MSDERLLSFLPVPTEDIEQAVADLAEHGLCVISGVLDQSTLSRVTQQWQ